MAINKEKYFEIIEQLKPKGATLVAVSKIRTVKEILDLYNLGQRDFGENYVQELVDKQQSLPKDIRWHFIGHLQSNKVKYIAPFVHLIHGVDSFKLLKEINKQAEKNNRIINTLLQIHIAREETKFGLDEGELKEIINRNSNQSRNEFVTSLHKLKNVNICGLMGMASFTEDEEQIKKEFSYLKSIFDKYAQLPTANCKLSTLSTGMSADYKIALEEGSTLVRIGSLLFGNRSYPAS
jgi:pyridoxal phosphate enzyme (YggS family)